jgi:hypothetical protein
MAAAIAACAFSLALRHNAPRIALSRERHDFTKLMPPFPKFVLPCRETRYELRKRKGHQQIRFASAAFDLKLLFRILGALCRSFKSAALVAITLY